jgi:hypothetical protein
LTGKKLAPREVIHNLKEHLLEAGPALLTVKAETAKDGLAKEIIGGVVTEAGNLGLYHLRRLPGSLPGEYRTCAQTYRLPAEPGDVPEQDAGKRPIDAAQYAIARESLGGGAPQ